MGLLEAVVVIYLRKLFYTTGFDFPLKGFIEPYILNIEWVREFATIVMLICIGALAGKKFYEKFAYFIYAFGIWDIFYYIFLKLYLDWPASFFTLDLLFLIPWPWVGPVFAPILCSMLMIITAYIIISFWDRKIKARFNFREWAMIILGGVVVLYTWLYDYGKIVISGGIMENYIPSYFNWPVFLLGLGISSLGVLVFYLRSRK